MKATERASGRVVAAAIQMEARVADLQYNIAQAGDLVQAACKRGARYVALPEFFTTAIILDDRLWKASVRKENPALEMMKSLAHQYEACIGGSYLEYDDDLGDVFNTYVLCEPNGQIHRHRKDLPTMVESAYYVGGDDDGLVQTADTRIGIAVCWETIRSQTVERLNGRCDVIMSGSHWWSEPGFPIMRRLLKRQAELNADHMFRAPGRFATMVGAPLLHAAHCGDLTGGFAVTKNWRVPSKTHLVGEAQIVDAEGRILARREHHEGPGVISAEVSLGAVPGEPKLEGYWLEDLPSLVRLTWLHQNHVGKKIYEQAKRDDKIQPFDFKRNSLQ